MTFLRRAMAGGRCRIDLITVASRSRFVSPRIRHRCVRAYRDTTALTISSGPSHQILHRACHLPKATIDRNDCPGKRTCLFRPNSMPFSPADAGGLNDRHTTDSHEPAHMDAAFTIAVSGVGCLCRQERPQPAAVEFPS